MEQFNTQQYTGLRPGQFPANQLMRGGSQLQEEGGPMQYAQQEGQYQALGAGSGGSADKSNPIDARDKAAAKQRQKEIEAQKKVSDKEIAARLKIAQMQSGDSRANTAAQVEAERLRIAQAAEEMNKIGIPSLDLERWKAEQYTKLQQSAQTLDENRFKYEQGKDLRDLEFEKAKWRDQNDNEIRTMDFNERSFADNLQFEREKEADRLGLDRDTYVQQKTEQDRRYAADLTQQGFSNNLALREQSAAESQFAEKMGFDKYQFAETQRQEAEQFAATYGLDRDKFNADNAMKERQQGFTESSFAETMANRKNEFARTQALEEEKQREQSRQFGVTTQEGARQFDLTTAEGRRQYDQSQALRERQQGAQEYQFGATQEQQQKQFETSTALDVAKTAATMGGPGDWANYLDYTEGVQNAGDAPVFMQRLLGQNPAGGGRAMSGAAPPPRTLAGVVGNLAGTPQPGAAGGGGIPDNDPSLRGGGGMQEGDRLNLQQGGGAPPPRAGGGPVQMPTMGPDGGSGTPRPLAGMEGQGGGMRVGMPAQSDSSQQVAQLARANPPSQGGGWNNRDMQVLNQIEQIYKAPQRADSYGTMSSDQRAFLAGGAAKVGQSQATFEDKWKKSRVGQGSALG